MIQERFQGKNYPNCSEASTCLFSRTEISFLACEEGIIDIDVNDSCTLQGLEIFLFRYSNKHQTLFCQKFTSNLLIQSPYLMGAVSSNYILVDCFCREENFSFQVGLPVFSQTEVAAKVCSANQSHTASFKILKNHVYLRSMTIFPDVSSTHFGLIQGGELLFSQAKKDGILECTMISDSFVSGEYKQERNSVVFHDWQIEKSSYIQTNKSTKRMIYFSDPSVTIMQKEGSKEFLVVGAQVKLLCSVNGIWGLCFFREGALSSNLQSEATTIISGTKKKPSFVMEQVPSHDAKSISDCDPKEGPSHSEKSISYCNPGEVPSQGAKKRSAECLKLHFADQDPLWSSAHVPKKGNFKEIKSATQVVLLSPGPLDDPSQRPLAASMIKPSVDAVPVQSASLQLPDSPSFISKESQKTTFDSSPFDLGLGTAFQGMMSPLSTISSRFFQQNPSSITFSESTSTTSSLGILSISQKATQLNENAWKTILDIINTNHSSTTPAERISTITSLEISSQSNEEIWEDLFAIMDK